MKCAECGIEKNNAVQLRKAGQSLTTLARIDLFGALAGCGAVLGHVLVPSSKMTTARMRNIDDALHTQERVQIADRQ